MPGFLRISLKIIIGIALLWGALTFYVQGEGPVFSTFLGEAEAKQTALILYDPDPFYDLDAQVCLGIGEVFSQHGWRVQVSSVKAMQQAPRSDYNLYVFCANTYNWAPDKALVQIIRNWPNLDRKNAIAITLGSGSTARAQRLLEKELLARKVNVLGSRSLWLMRPNDEDRMDEENVDVAVSMAKSWAKSLVQKAS